MKKRVEQKKETRQTNMAWAHAHALPEFYTEHLFSFKQFPHKSANVRVIN